MIVPGLYIEYYYTLSYNLSRLSILYVCLVQFINCRDVLHLLKKSDFIY